MTIKGTQASRPHVQTGGQTITARKEIEIMKKITTVLNSPTRIALFAVCCVLLISIVAFATIQAGAGVNANKTLGMDKGVNIALNDAGLRAEDVRNLSAHYDTEDGVPVYEIKFTAGGFSYEYQIKASDGTIIEADRGAATKTGVTETQTTDKNTQDGTSDNSTAAGKITKARAKELALAHAGVSASKATFVEAKLDYEDGVQVYEIEFYSGSTEYDYEINAETGEILSFDKDIENFSIPKKNNTSSGSSQTTPSSNYIGVDKAKSIALKNAGLSASSVTFTKAKLDREDGVRVYEIEFYTSTKEYEYEINAKTGKIRDKDVEYFDDDDDDDWDDDDWDDDWDD